jgi:hypothetical protein
VKGNEDVVGTVRSSYALRIGAIVLFSALSFLHAFTARLLAQHQTTVGMSGKLEQIVLPGSELEAKPLTDRTSPVVVRVVRVYPHGTAFRYDLEYAGLAPGTHDLRAYLRRKDGSPLGELPPLLVKVDAVLPPGQIEPNKLEIERGPRVGGYRVLAIVLCVLWALGLAALVVSFFFPRRKKSVATSDKPVTLADRLRPLVEGAIAGKLSRVELANLERSLMAYWRKRLNLESAEPGEAVEAMRQHREASPLLARLEAWLHRPGPVEPVDVAALLEPYRNLPPEAIDLAGGPR